MGSCLSKKSARASSSSSSSSPPPPSVSLPENPKSESEKTKTEEENYIVRKDIFIIKHRKSHEIERQENGEPDADKGKSAIVPPSNSLDGGAPVRTLSCTKEEVDAILIQCGRLSRSSSAAENGGRKYSGSKRSYDFDGEGGGPDGDDDAAAKERENRRHQSQGRRRTPSRERDQQRSGGGRRVSRSPGRRSESPIAAKSNSRPVKMVSVPATVGGGGEAAVKRIQVKRNVSPRARSPARVRASNDNQQQQPMSLSRSNSRKAEHSPYRRNPLAEIDTNIIPQKPSAESKTVQVVSDNTKNNNPTTTTTTTNVGAAETYGIQSHIGLNVISSSPAEDPKPQSLTRSRSSRLSRDLDIAPETLSSNPNNTPSYTALLLEDIHNFHQKNSNTPTPAFTLPPCVTKACSILEAVADLNSSNGSNLSSSAPKKKTKPDPILESEVAANDDLTEPSFHKYVTVRRGTSDENQDREEEEQESSGSNSFAGSQQHWVSSSSWEPNSAESTDRWTSSSTTSSSSKVGGAKRNGIGRGRMGARSSKNMAAAAAVST